MKHFIIIPFNREVQESQFDSISILHNLETLVKERICRKDCRCSFCHNIIKRGDKALKTIQRCDHRGNWYNSYCQDCYKEQ
jgi:ferredoxin